MGTLAHLHPSRGFALITVLVSLATITLLFAAASTLTLTRLQDNAILRDLSLHEVRTKTIAAVAMTHYASEDADLTAPFSVQMEGEIWEVRLQDVSGLVDLNTASPALLKVVIGSLGLTPKETEAALTHLRTWRREGHRLLRISDAARIMKLDHLQAQNLRMIATVFSGSTGFAPEIAPQSLLESVAGSGASRRDVPEAFRSPARNANFLLIISSGASARTTSFVVNRGQESWRILGMQ
ncbi:hypothetical protein [Halovulum sp. GXIMD14793]